MYPYQSLNDVLTTRNVNTKRIQNSNNILNVLFVYEDHVKCYAQAFFKEALTENAYICQRLTLCIRKKLNNHVFNKNHFGTLLAV